MSPPARRRPFPARFRLTARGWVYLALTSSVALTASVKANNLLFALFSLLVGLLVVSAVLTFVSARQVEVSRLLPEAVWAGELFTLRLRFRNAKRFWPAFCLKVEDRLAHEGRPAAVQPPAVWLPFARPGERVRATGYATAHERGWAALGPLAVTSEFVPGLFVYRRTLPVRDSLLVLPRPALLNRRVLAAFLTRASFDEAAAAFAPGDLEPAGLRDYRPGDPLRRIHWKMSARRPGRLLVREFDDPRVRDGVLLLETFAPNAADARRRGRLERAIRFAAALAETLLEEGWRLRFRAFGPDPVRLDLDPGRAAADELLYALALLRPTRVHPVGDLVAPEPGEEDSVAFLLRISDDPLPPSWEERPRALAVTPQDMKALIFESHGEEED